jgi:hypothetical protein
MGFVGEIFQLAGSGDNAGFPVMPNSSTKSAIDLL